MAYQDADSQASALAQIWGKRVEARKPALFRRIIFWIVVPVVFAAVLISGLLISYLTPPIDAFLKHQFDANLRLASTMGLRICQASFDYLLDLRLEDNVEMNLALQREALEEIKAISKQVPMVHLLVFDGKRNIKTWSLDTPVDGWEIPDNRFENDSTVSFDVNGKVVRAHVLFFPFWDWRIASFVFEKDYLSPIRDSHNIIYFSMLGVFVSVFATLLLVYHLFVNNPLQQLITATKDVAHGNYSPIAKVANNEIGQLMSAFNAMIQSLDREKAEVRHLINQLRVSESQLRTLFDNAPLGICLITPKGTILRTNPSMQQIMGVGEEEIIKMKFIDLFETPGDGFSLLADVVRQQTIDDHETILRHKEGLTFPVRMLLTMIVLSEQQVIYAIIENVTDQKKLEDQLNQARKLEAIGSLAGGIAHDFNNLLTPIIGFTEILMQNQVTDSQQHTQLNAILSAAQKARGIVRQLLAFSRKQTLEVKTIDLNAIIENFFGLLQRTIREDIQLERMLKTSISRINADPGQLEQIILNLVVNAQDALPEGGRITIETSEAELDEAYASSHPGVFPGRYVMMAVSDNGHGMDAKTLERIFDPFFTTKEKGRGTGFGLATVYGIVKQHRGNIWVYSEPGRGTTFKLYFPISGEVLIEHTEGPLTLMPPRSTAATILIVEDDESVLDLAITILKAQDYHILSALKAGDALRLVSSYNGEIDLLLTDVVMPDMNGRELHAEIIKIFPEIKVIYMSGYTNNVIAHHGIIDKGVEFIQKPFSFSKLVMKVQKVLDTSGG